MRSCSRAVVASRSGLLRRYVEQVKAGDFPGADETLF